MAATATATTGQEGQQYMGMRSVLDRGHMETETNVALEKAEIRMALGSMPAPWCLVGCWVKKFEKVLIIIWIFLASKWAGRLSDVLGAKCCLHGRGPIYRHVVWILGGSLLRQLMSHCRVGSGQGQPLQHLTNLFDTWPFFRSGKRWEIQMGNSRNGLGTRLIDFTGYHENESIYFLSFT